MHNMYVPQPCNWHWGIIASANEDEYDKVLN